MTLDEAIRHCEEVASGLIEASENADLQGDEKEAKGCCECAREHKQLAEWLKELKAYKGRYHKYYRGGRV